MNSIQEITFNDIPTALQSVIAQLDRMERRLSEIKQSTEAAAAKAETDGPALYFGRFKRGEVIRSTDPRLWENSTPYFNRNSVWVAATKEGTKWRKIGGHYYITAEDLYEQFTLKEAAKRFRQKFNIKD